VPPLTGIKVLDLSKLPPADLSTMYLGDMGAEVIRVEAPPSAGGRARGFNTRQISKDARREEMFYAPNRNKKSVYINLKEEPGRQVLYKLAKWADVMVESFRPGAVKRLAIDYDTISKLNPGIVYCSISGYGQTGPYAQVSGHDANYLSVAGVLSIIGDHNGEPIFPMNLVADYSGGSMHAVIGILAALMARQTTGKGQHVDISMTDGAMGLLSVMVGKYLASGVLPRRGEGLINGRQPAYTFYKTKDGRYVTVGCIEPWFWEALCKFAGREDFIPFEFDETAKRDEIRKFFEEFFLTRTADEWVALMRPKDIPVAKVLNLDEALADPQMVHRKMVTELQHPELGPVKQVGIAIKFSDTPGEIKSLPPESGQHTSEVLRKLGYSEKEIEAMREAGVIG